jgi:thiol-disulfide isomerase/thioredoxin
MPLQIRSTINKNARKQLTWKILLASGFFLIGFAFIFSIPKSGEDNSLSSEYFVKPNEVDFPSPKLTLTDLSSRSVSLDDYHNIIVLVNNWATWCPPCKAEMPTLQKYYEIHAEQGFIVIAIESGESKDEVSTFVQNNSLTFPVWIDIKGLALEKFNNWDLPSSYVIDRGGQVRLSWTGPISMEMLEKYVTPLLEQ